MKIAKPVRLELQELVQTGAINTYEKSKVCTCVSPLHEFTSASEEHQQYWMKHPNVSMSQRLYFADWPDADESFSSSNSTSSSICFPTSASSSLSSSSSFSSVMDEEQRSRMRALEKFRRSQRRQEMLHSIVCSLSSC